MRAWIRNFILLMAGAASLSGWAGENEARVGLATGITSVDHSQMATDRLSEMFYLGLVGDFGFTPFIGVEGEGYFGTGSVERAQSGYAIQNRVGSLEQWGILANVKFEYPIEAENWIIRPKAGVGFGYLSLALKNDYQTFAQASVIGVGTTSRTFGVYGILGVEAEPGELMILSADFAFSFAATREFDAGISVGQFPLPVQNPGFTRLRLGAHFRLSESLLLGAQFIERRITGDTLYYQPSTDLLSPAQRHFLISVMLAF